MMRITQAMQSTLTIDSTPAHRGKSQACMTEPNGMRAVCRRYRRTFVGAISTLLLGASAPLLAADDWYTIEVAIFERLSEAALAEERWPERIDESRSGLSFSASDRARVKVLTAGRAEASSVVKVSRKSLAYGGLMSRMARSGQFRPLVHMGWRQPGLSKTEAVPVSVSGASSASPEASEVRGTLRLYRSRYLHLEANLVLAKPVAAYAPANTNSATRFSLRESRRMRSGELHYLDHPLFGMLVRVTPFRRAGGTFVSEPKPPKSKNSEPKVETPAKKP